MLYTHTARRSVLSKILSSTTRLFLSFIFQLRWTAVTCLNRAEEIPFIATSSHTILFLKFIHLIHIYLKQNVKVSLVVTQTRFHWRFFAAWSTSCCWVYDFMPNKKCPDISRAVERLKTIDCHDALVLLRSSFSAPKMQHSLRRCSWIGNTNCRHTIFCSKTGRQLNTDLSDSETQWL